MSQQELHIDKILFERISQGDENAFTEIFYKYTAKLFPFVSNLISSDAWAEEILQDVFLRLWRARDNMNSIENPSAYLYQIASNRTLDYIRRNAKEVKLQYYVARKQDRQDKNFTQNDVDFREADAILKEAVKSLPAPKKKSLSDGKRRRKDL